MRKICCKFFLFSSLMIYEGGGGVFGRMVATMITIMIFTYFIFAMVFYVLHETVQQNIDALNFNVVEVVSTSGFFSSYLYEYLQEQAGRYGDYRIQLKLEKQVKPGVYDTFFDPLDIIDKKLQIGDRISIYLEDKQYTLFGRLINMAYLGHSQDKFIDIRIKSMKTAMIAKSAKDLVKGYDVIVDIEEMAANDNIAVFVVTKRNPIQGKYYGVSSHEDVDIVNLHYGDSTDESDNSGLNYIFENGDFIKKVLYYENGSEKLIQYYQQ